MGFTEQPLATPRFKQGGGSAGLFAEWGLRALRENPPRNNICLGNAESCCRPFCLASCFILPDPDKASARKVEQEF